MTAGTLYVVATPIGNLDDLSPRARQVLSDVDFIAAEDTRHTGRLLQHFGIQTRQLTLHDHNESSASVGILAELAAGRSVALVSDAGTPLVSDPGFKLVRAAHHAGIKVSPIPGPSAAIAAMSVAGLPSDCFAFEGFLPAKRDARVRALTLIATDTRSLVFFEAVHRVTETIADMATVFGADRLAYLGRELSKMHEQGVLARLADLHEKLVAGEIVSKGEFVIIVEGAKEIEHENATVDAVELLAELVDVMPGKQAVDLVAKLSGQKRNEVYRKMLELKAD